MLDISGNVNIFAKNVTIRNSKIHGSDYWGINVHEGDATIMDTEIYGFSDEAILFSNWKGYRLNIHSMGSDGLKLGSNVVLQDSYIHDFTTSPGSHADGAQYHQKGYSVTSNHFLRTYNYGVMALNEPDSGFTAWSGNVFDDNGQVINR